MNSFCLTIYPPLLSQLDSYLIGEGRALRVNLSEPKMRLFVGNIPKTLRKEDILKVFESHTGNVYNLAWLENGLTLLLTLFAVRRSEAL